MIREQHGIARARRLSAIENSETQAVLITDSNGEIILSLSACAYPAGLTPAQADFVADQLIAAARRVRAQTETKPQAEKA
jgi:DNA-binding IclR family transcriptional regulator